MCSSYGPPILRPFVIALSTDASAELRQLDAIFRFTHV